jgi:heme exporter protein D
MKSWHEFLTMGGYAVYVWPAYGIAFVTLLANAVWPGRQQRALLKELRRQGTNSEDHSI